MYGKIRKSVRTSLLIGLALMAVGAPEAVGDTRTVQVSASSSDWSDTGIELTSSGASLTAITGDATCHAGGASDCPIGNPAGSGRTCSAAGVEAGPAGDGVPYGGLAGRVVGAGSGRPFAIAGPTRVPGPGRLQLVFNDCAPPRGYGDNAGSFTVQVCQVTTVRSAAFAGAGPIGRGSSGGNCPPTQLAAKAETKATAEALRRNAVDASLVYGGYTIVVGSASNIPVPHPAWKVTTTILSTVSALLALWETYQAEQYARVVSDPPDPRWRTIARAPRVFLDRLPIPPGLSRTRTNAFRAFSGAVLRNTALAQCVAHAIDRGATAFANRNPAVAAAQYRAGAACAAANARVLASLPRLSRPILATLKPFDARIKSVTRSSTERRLRAAAPRLAGLLPRLISVPRARVAALLSRGVRTAMTPAARSAPAPSSVMSALIAQQAAGAATMRDVATELRLAAGAR